MSNKIKAMLAGAAIVLVLGVLGVGAVSAANPPGNPTDYQSALLGKVATILGIDQQKVTDAFNQAAKDLRNQQIDDAVAAGRITQEYGNWLKQMPGNVPFGHGFGPGMHGPGGRFGGMPPAGATQTPRTTQ